MHGDWSTPARAIVRVVPERAACYWKAVSEALGRAGAHAAKLEVNVLEPSTDAADGAPRLVVLEMRCVGLEQAVLDEAVRFAGTECDGQADGHQKAASEPIGRGPGATIKDPLLPRLMPTMHAPLFGKLPVVAPPETEPGPADEPVPAAEPTPAQEPVRAAEPFFEEKPVLAAEPFLDETPVLAPVVVPPFVDEPVAAAQPFFEERPALAAEPVLTTVPPVVDEPVLAVDAVQRTPQPLQVARPRAETWLALKAHALEAFRVVIALVAAAIGLRLMIQTFSVDGPSMQPTFQTDQRLLINRVAYWHVDGTPFEGLIPSTRQGSVAYVFGGPHRGDVVVFRPPGDSGFQSDLIKRVIGLPGDTVSIQAGQVFVNGQPIVEPYVQFPADYTYPDQGLAVLIPNDSYFVLGDNRPVSVDSHFGWVVPADKLVGEAWVSYWPISRWRLVPGGEISIGG